MHHRCRRCVISAMLRLRVDELGQTLQTPAPRRTGRSCIGCTDVEIPSPATPHVLHARLFFPVQHEGDEAGRSPCQSGRTASWVPGGLMRTCSAASFSIAGKLIAWMALLTTTNFAWFEDMRAERKHVLPDQVQQQVRQPSRLKFAVFSHGRGAAGFAYSAICAEIAACGYLVCAITAHFDGTALLLPQKNRHEIGEAQCALRVLEVRAAFDYILQDACWGTRLDVSESGDALVVGHSLGGDTALEAAVQDKRFSTVILLDAPLRICSADVYRKHKLDAVHNFMCIQGANSLGRVLACVASLRQNESRVHVLQNTAGLSHHQFSELFYILPSWLRALVEKILDFNVPSRDALEGILRVLRAFLLNDGHGVSGLDLNSIGYRDALGNR
ncbi:Platelet-activating factor acetylhydrolase [Porphyridium purpureum]|uniref:1-alkyl-2-acetylglycerophosphocholine esterase n=1 Tax=Porphyridium purpureum TaxID=35688 RepID=A0A5J4YL34_PORPP|nr:Platelet-activating factor acetylhydrolase [Porphyridium purpureum]|eukprot:POR0564..scf249_10